MRKRNKKEGKDKKEKEKEKKPNPRVIFPLDLPDLGAVFDPINGRRSPVLGIAAERATGARRVVQGARGSLREEAMAPAHPQARAVRRPRRCPG